MKTITLKRWVVLDCDGKPLGYQYPWTYPKQADAEQIAAYFANSRVKQVRVTIEDIES